MSYAIDLGVDYGTSEQVADQIVEHFDGFRILLPADREVECAVTGKAQRLNHWFVGVIPKGMGYGVPDCRPELVEPMNYEAIKSALYGHLSLVSGYRRAWFASEAFDSFTSPTPEELAWIDYPEMIFASRAFPSIPTGTRVVQFSPGYLRVTEIHHSCESTIA